MQKEQFAGARPASDSPSGGVKYLAFTLGNEEYAIEISQVRELRGYEPATRLPSAPDYVLGVINLRGTIVPVADLRIKLGLGKPTYSATTVVIIAKTDNMAVGLVVDGVSDVHELTAEQLRPAPDLGTDATDYVVGLGIVAETTLILTDVAKLISRQQLDCLAAEPALA